MVIKFQLYCNIFEVIIARDTILVASNKDLINLVSLHLLLIAFTQIWSRYFCLQLRWTPCKSSTIRH